MIRKRAETVLILCLAVSTFAFAFLWLAEKNSRDDVKELAQAAAADAYTQFSAYLSHGDISDYWDGAASFRAFQQAYQAYGQGTNKETDSLICREVSGYLIAEPEKSQAHMADLVRIMELLSENAEDLNGHAQMLELRNALSHSE